MQAESDEGESAQRFSNFESNPGHLLQGKDRSAWKEMENGACCDVAMPQKALNNIGKVGSRHLLQAKCASHCVSHRFS